MKNRFFTKSRPAMRLLTIAVICSMLPWSAAWGGLQPPLSQVPVPVPRTNAELALPQFSGPNGLQSYITDVPAAIRLGKALFWDMQAGSDGVQACASCHYFAGADPIANATNPLAKRDTNQLNPGPDSTFQVKNPGPNSTLIATDFPFFQLNPPLAQITDLIPGIDPLTGLPAPPKATLSRNFNDVVGSQGISFTDFLNITAGSVDAGNPTPDPVFGNSRRVTGRNSPSVINAVFNFTNFWDGRANNIFNGVNPSGPLDQGAVIYIDNGRALVPQQIAIPNASLASQATGPPLNDTEMSFTGRTFPELGKKMLTLTPLGLQLVHLNDSVFSVPVQLSRATGGNPAPGLNTNYTQMIQAAFQPNLTGNRTVSLATKAFPNGEPFTQIEANFSLFWGLAIMLYEATLVSDQTPFDRFQLGNQNALDPIAQKGLTAFDDKCAVCHAGSEFTIATVGSQVANGGLGDIGFFNIGVRPTLDDIGRGGGSFKTPGLRNVELTAPYFHNGGAFTLEDVVSFYGRGGNFTIDAPPVSANPELAAAMLNIASGGLRGKVGDVAAFLRGLTDDRVKFEKAPFDHPQLLVPSGDVADTKIDLPATGGFLTPVLVQALTLDPVTTPTSLTSQVISGTVDATATVAVSITNVATGITLPPAVATVGGTVAGIVGGVAQAANAWSLNLSGLALGDNNIAVTATSVTGDKKSINSPLPITVLPTATINGTPQIVTRQTGATLTVGGVGVDTYQFKVDGGALNGVEIPVATPIALSNLADGLHIVAVIGKNTQLNLQQDAANAATATWSVKANPPVLTLDPVATPARKSVLTIGGTVELGLPVPPVVRADTSAVIGPVQVIGGSGIATWSCQVSGLKSGVTNFTVTATDIALNVTSKTVGVTAIVPDGNLKGTGSTDLSDALRALRIAVGLDSPSADEMLRGDVAPLVNDVPAPDNKIDVTDAVVILRKVVGLINF